MSEPANRPLKPDGTRYRPGERLALAAAKMNTPKSAEAPSGSREPKKESRVKPRKEYDFNSEIDRALRLMRGGR